ncbi:MAG: hypothetical protein YK1309IOTA_1390002 [Marine Group I thaumarchaeote]|nr:MAG: hypothetical protein YK1309IOTA_1390002 [Marine Group I thaumarchaeote]
MCFLFDGDSGIHETYFGKTFNKTYYAYCMVIRHSSFVNRIRILEYMLKNSDSVEWRNKVIGYGLIGSDLRKTKQANKEFLSRDIFNDYCDELLMDGHISRLKHSDKRLRYYTITPLGICFLIWSNGGLPTTISQIQRILLSFYNHRKIKSKLLPKVKLEPESLDALKKSGLDDNDIFFQAIKNNIVFSGMHYENPLERIHQENIVTISLNVSDSMKLKLAELKILRFNYIILYEDNLNIENSFECNLSLAEFYSYLSLFMLVLFFCKMHNFDDSLEFLFDPIRWGKKFTNNPMLQIINSLLKHVNEQMGILYETGKLNLKK